MMVSFYITIALLCAYGILFQLYHAWWMKIPSSPALSRENRLSISVIIPARNEAACIAACIESVCAQDYPRDLFEIILVDDASTDNTSMIAAQAAPMGIRMLIHKLDIVEKNTAPKKRAIEQGISLAAGELIVTTDADCVVPPGWLREIAAYHGREKKVFIAAPVKIVAGRSLLSKFQALDFLTMQGITGASVFKQMHNMCNGANLAYERRVFYAVDGFRDIDNIASGDDMLLMNKVSHRFPGELGFLRSDAAIVDTAAAAGWKAFFQQRIRWASKATHYRDPKTFLVLLLVYLTNLLIFCFLVLGFFQPAAWILFLLLCVAKFAMEFFFVKEIALFFRQTQLLPWLLILQPMHIMYIVVSGFLGQFSSYEWKGRKLK